jgi:hypothetical protein
MPEPDPMGDRRNDNIYGYGNPDQAPEGPSGGFITDGSEPGAGFDGIGASSPPSNETETSNGTWMTQGGEYIYG